MTFTRSASMPVRKQRFKAYSRDREEFGPIEVCLFNAGSNVNKSLLETTEKLFFKAWELACYGGFRSDVRLPRHAATRTRHHLLYGGDRQCKWRTGVCGIFICEARTSRSSPGDGAQLGPKNFHVVHLLIDAGVSDDFTSA